MLREQRKLLFEIPQILAGKYDVYVDFVPPVIDGVALAEEKNAVGVPIGLSAR